MQFGKIKALQADIEEVRDALVKSTKLELNEEKTKIRRINPVLPQLKANLLISKKRSTEKNNELHGGQVKELEEDP